MWGYKSLLVYTRTPINAKHSCINHVFVKNNNLMNQFQAGVIQTNITQQLGISIPIIKTQKSISQYEIETVNYKEVINKLSDAISRATSTKNMYK